MARALFQIYESERQGMTAELLEEFKRKAANDGASPTTALARIIRRYVARGFDDGQPTTSSEASAPPENP